VRFCSDPNCAGATDDIEKTPEAWLRIERAFYIGKRTKYRWAICSTDPADLPVTNECTPVAVGAARTETLVTKCKIEGCRPGSATSSCTGDKHFCEDD
jgi:hypothetical protein